MNEWGSRTVTDVVGTAGSIVLSDESTAQRDWLHDYYEGLDADEPDGGVDRCDEPGTGR